MKHTERRAMEIPDRQPAVESSDVGGPCEVGEAEERAYRFAARLQPALSQSLPPDAASSKALALAWLAVRFAASDSDVERDIHLLPAFIEAEQGRGTREDLQELVRRFVQGARPRTTRADGEFSGKQPHDRAQRRQERLRELRRWGVDLSLVEAALARTPSERIHEMERQLAVVRQLQRATPRRQIPG
ncbi:MAG TPA: hypothetical protein VNL71_10775 [Chloroflexota bacterium]|nr:hypothetical protein [Chloroflexota bacterium]